MPRLLLPLLCAAVLLTGCGRTTGTAAEAPEQLPVPVGAQRAVVVRHTDGDTFWLRGVGVGPVPARRTKVRLLEVDTPEVFGTPGCFGHEASLRTAALLPIGAQVRVEADQEPRDRYGRLLLYVWTPAGASLEEELLREGYARVLYVRPNHRHLDVLREVQAQARRAGRGLWSACPRT